ncbi:MAG: alpha/beta hydrolase [Bacteroidetes bacterium]|nr:alpha/beta hydrolase [Bacteroidota bacterium]
MNQNHSSVFGIPGLGTDDRIFSRLELDLPINYINWLDPDSDEPLSEYAARMARPLMEINSPIVVGVSFGGILALEISRIKELKGIIIISGIKNPQEKPFSFQLMQKLPFYRLTKGNWRIKTIPLWSPGFGIRSNEEQNLLKNMFSTFNDNYRMWAIRQVAHWKGCEVNCPVYHLHGQKDKVFPAGKIEDAHLVEGGTHFMVYQRANQMSDLLNQKIGEWSANS